MPPNQPPESTERTDLLDERTIRRVRGKLLIAGLLGLLAVQQDCSSETVETSPEEQSSPNKAEGKYEHLFRGVEIVPNGSPKKRPEKDKKKKQKKSNDAERDYPLPCTPDTCKYA